MPRTSYSDGDYSLGMIRDLASWELPSGAVYDAQNYLWTRPGAARMRMASTAIFSGTQAGNGTSSTSMGFVYSQDSNSTIEELYVAPGSSGEISRVNQTTGVYTTVDTGLSGVTIGRPAQHFGFTVFTGFLASTTIPRAGRVVAGITSNTSFTNTANATVAANSGTVTLTGGDATTNVKVGAIVTFVNTTQFYWGRVVSVTDSTHFVSWPPFTFTGTAAAGGMATVPSIQMLYGACATSFQNRLVYGNVTVAASSPVAVADRRLTYGALPTETYTSAGGVTYSGMAAALGQADLIALDYIDVPGTGPFLALEPVADNQLLILTPTRPVLLRGNLVTQLSTTSPTITFDTTEIRTGGSCVSDKGVQRTPKGVVWVGYDGVHLWTGSDPLDLTGDRENKLINSYWRSLTGASNFTLYGSAFVEGHLIIHGTSGGAAFSLACDMTGSRPKWGRFAGAGTDLYMSAPRPSVPSQVFGLRRAASYVGGQVVRIDSMFKPYVTGAATLDSDGSAVATTITTRPVGGDQATQKLWQAAVLRYFAEMDTAAVTVTGQSKTDAADINTGSVRALGSLSNTATRTITAATNASPIAITTSAVHGLQTDDFVNIDAVGGNTNANGRYRITVTGTTTFTLNASTGNANYTSGGQVQRVTEASFMLSGLNKGQAASLTIASSGTVKNLEIQGLKLVALEAPVGVVT